MKAHLGHDYVVITSLLVVAWLKLCECAPGPGTTMERAVVLIARWSERFVLNRCLQSRCAEESSPVALTPQIVHCFMCFCLAAGQVHVQLH